jgi:uncharacterized membrane protein YedE/YeeE
MSNTFLSTIKGQITDGYSLAFTRKWPSWVGGVLIAIVALMIFLWNAPWGIAGGYHNWGDWIFYLIGLSDNRPELPWLHTLSVSNAGIFIGGLASALLSRQFKFRRAPGLEYIKALVGGTLMGIGAALAGGCNVGGFYSAVSGFDIGGYAMMIGLGIGSFIGLKYLLWEMEHLPAKQAAPPSLPSPGHGPDWEKIKPYIGALIATAVVAAFYAYSAFGQALYGGLLFFGFLIGLFMHRSRFCFVRSFREPFMTGDADMVRAVAISLIIYGCGSAVIKFMYIQDPHMGVFHPFWLGSLAGGLIFGIGMLVAGGCASSALWRAAEGHSKLMVTVITFAITNAASHNFLEWAGLKGKLGTPHFLPDLISWQFALPLFVLFFLVWIMIANWNEEAEKFVIF